MRSTPGTVAAPRPRRRWGDRNDVSPAREQDITNNYDSRSLLTIINPFARNASPTTSDKRLTSE